MKNTMERFSTFSTALFSTTLGLFFAIFLYSYLNPRPQIHGDISIPWISDTKASYKALRFIPNIDLGSQFTLNTKQIFLYLILKDKISNKEEMVWSKIVQNGDNYKLNDICRSNYIFTGNNRNIYEFELRGNIFPFVGQLLDVGYGILKYKAE